MQSCFTLYDLGQYGSNNDSGMGSMFEENKLRVPNADTLPSCEFDPLPYYLLGDQIFPPKEWLMRPFPGNGASEDPKIYNYRHSRARRVIEIAFSLMVARWRILLKPIRSPVDKVRKHLLANNASYCPSAFVDAEDENGNIKPGEWRNSVENEAGCFQQINNSKGRRSKNEPIAMRDAWASYLTCKDGQLPWQLQAQSSTKATLHIDKNSSLHLSTSLCFLVTIHYNYMVVTFPCTIHD